MIDLAALETCSDLTSEHAKQAASSSEEIRTLLKRVSDIARPGEGCPKVLMAVARLVGQEWVEGELRVELSGDESSTTLVIICEYGEGIRERLVPAAKFAVPIDEFERALELSPKLVMPLRITDELDKIVLTPLASAEPKKSVPPPELVLDDASLAEEERKTSPPPPDELQVIDEAVSDQPPLAEESFGEFDFGEESPEPPRDSGPVPIATGGGVAKSPNVHTRPTVRRMVAIDAAAIAAVKRRDPRREDD